MPSRDPIYDAQLLRDLDIINEQTSRELGPLPAGGSLVMPKHQSGLPRPTPTQPDPQT
jgi:hypothetical protein